MEIIYPGIVERKAPKVKRIMEQVEENKYLRECRIIVSLIAHQIDLFKDSFLVLSIFGTIGGIETLINFPREFPSVVVIIMALTIILPVLLSSITLLLRDPTVIFTPLFENFPTSSKLKYYAQFQIFLFSFFNPALLVNAYNENVAQRSQESGEQLLRRLQEGRRIKKQYVKYLKSEMGLEIFYQVPIQIVLLIFSFTITKGRIKKSEWNIQFRA